MARPFNDLTGERFGRLKVIKFSGYIEQSKRKYPQWLCKCDCGKEKIVSARNLLAKNTSSCGCIRGFQYEKSASHSLYSSYRLRSIKKGHEFSLTEDEFINLTSQNCYYCGREPLQDYNPVNCPNNYIYNGLDRVDSSKGYTIDNCVPCCKYCNQAKSTMSIDEFLTFIERVYKWNILKMQSRL